MNSSRKKNGNGRMGSCSSNKKGILLIDDDGDVTFKSKPKSLNDCLLLISNQNAKSTKQDALLSIVRALTLDVRIEFVYKNCSTLLYHCLLFIKKGKLTEFDLAAKIIGLLVLIVDDENSGNEICKDSVLVFSQVIECQCDSSKISKILNCLGIVAFFGAYNSDELQEIMRIIWKFLQGKSDLETDSAAVAISAWSFLLSSMEVWHINQKDWQSAICILLNILEASVSCNESVFIAAAEALALIFEINCFEKFSTEVKEIDDLKQKIIGNLDIGDDGTEQKARASDVLHYFESGKISTSIVKIGKDKVLLASWCQRIQLNFIKRFIGEEGFVRHMKQNENLQAVFEFTPTKRNAIGNGVASLEREEVSTCFFHPKVELKDDGSLLPFVSKEAKLCMDKMNGRGPNSLLKKARTHLMNKRRTLSQREKHQFFYDY